MNRRDVLLEVPEVLFPVATEETPEPPLFPAALGRLVVSRAAPGWSATAGPAERTRVQRDARHVGEKPGAWNEAFKTAKARLACQLAQNGRIEWL